MISAKVFITTSAFTLALAGAVITSSNGTPPTSYNGYDANTACVVTGPPREQGCSINSPGYQCTVITHPGTNDEQLTLAWLSPNLMPTCLFVLRTEIP